MAQPRISLPQQRPSCSKQTQAKAARLAVLDITARLAIVQGDHGEYYVDMQNVICSCKAGRDGLRCSHAMSALIERSRMAGYGEVTFFDDRLDAKVACVAHLKAGRKARVVEDNGYIFVEAQAPMPAHPQRVYPAYDAAACMFAIVADGVIVDRVRDYLVAEQRMQQLQGGER